ncbi:UNVERIFIED_CONTAM: hypothetical protein GTU68_010918 [Idotea baltica]|nr:hypothetical protein [Idotea baltica]
MNEDSEYCLRWHRHLTNFIESFGNLLENEDLADAYFFAEGQIIKAHKVVLSSCSPYFQSIFKETLERNPIIVLKDVKIDHIKALMEFMYRGSVNVPQEALEPIMKMAQTLNIKGLADGVVDIEKLEENEEHEKPMSLIHPKIANRQYAPPPHPPNNDSKLNRHLSSIYNTPSTSVHSVLSTALTMPSALSLTSSLSLPQLASLPPNLASSLASTLSSAIPQSFLPPKEMPVRDGGESPLQKRRKRHRRRSGETIDSGDSDCRSSGSPGDSSVPSLHLPRIPATITPIGLHRNHLQQYHQNNSQMQPSDLTVNSSHLYHQHHHNNHHDRPPLNSPHRERPHNIKPPPGLLPHHPFDNHHHQKPQEEPENLEHRPKDSKEDVKPQIPPEESRKSMTPPPSSTPPGRRSAPPARQSPPKCLSDPSDPESLVSPRKSQTRLDETSSDNNHYSDEERDEGSNGHRESANERLSNSTPGPSTSRPQSEEAPHTPSKEGFRIMKFLLFVMFKTLARIVISYEVFSFLYNYLMRYLASYIIIYYMIVNLPYSVTLYETAMKFVTS